MRFALVGAAAIVIGSALGAQSPPAFDVVSIKRSADMGPGGSSVTELPNGGVRLIKASVAGLLLRAYPGIVLEEIVDLPEWARRDAYDISATSMLARATPDDRATMMRTMLRERFGLVARLERRPQQTLALVLARKDGTLGAGLTKIDADCPAKQAADRAAAEAALAAGQPAPALRFPNRNAPPPPCQLRLVSSRDTGTRIDGEGTLADLGTLLRIETHGVLVVDQTGAPGSYRVMLTYQNRFSSAAGQELGPDATTALREQLGLKLDSVRIERDTLVIERLERPSEN